MLSDLPTSFAFHSLDVEAVFSHALAKDHARAQLSPAFRAYYALRSLIPLNVRQLLQRYRPVAAEREWYIPHAFCVELVDAIAKTDGGLPIIHPWPHGAEFALVLSHDVETAEGMRNVFPIAELESELGLRSVWNIVPHKYPVDLGLLRELSDRGFEIGVHGYNHDGKLFSSKACFDQRVPAINQALQTFGAVGFRAPMVHRNLEWLQSLNIEYDASCFDVDPYQAMPGGVGSLWPFLVGRFVELPYTLPQDHTLFVALNLHDGDMWRRKLNYLIRARGMALMLTHPDYLDSPRRLDVYRRFLAAARETAGVWHALPRTVAEWWRQRDCSTIRYDALGREHIVGPAALSGRPTRIQAIRDPRDQMQRSVAAACKSEPFPPLEFAECARGSATPGAQPEHSQYVSHATTCNLNQDYSTVLNGVII